MARGSRTVPSQATGHMQYADVVFNRPLKRPFTYSIPADLDWEVGVGGLVEATLNGRSAVGCVVAIQGALKPELEGKKILPLLAVVNPGYVIPEDILLLSHWMADYYYCGLGEAVCCASMIGMREMTAEVQRALTLSDPARWRRALEGDRAGEAPPEWKALTPKQRRLVECFLQAGARAMTRALISAEWNVGAAVVNKLLEKGILEERQIEVERADPYGYDLDPDAPPLLLNPHQEKSLQPVLQSLDDHAFAAFLLYGVTGSGKTEIYLRAIERTLERKRQAIMLVPEIALTPQTMERFRKRFGRQVGVYHSQMTLPEKFRLWKLIEAGRISVLVGARSALFAPFRSLGLIVIDEEHETSYKQSDPAPRYHARDVAIVRARQRRAVALLGSATPSLESFHNCEVGKYTLLKLPHRVSRLPMASTRLVDMREETTLRRNPSLLSETLKHAIGDRLEKQEQSIVFLNRRGFSCFQVCLECKAIPRCSRCDVSLTYHKGLNKLVCHYCDRALQPLKVCSDCGSDQVDMVGMGTERVEETLAEVFPQARILRIDLDTITTRNAFLRAWRKITSHEVDIILGTQMIAKGIHLENVTLVGVISADFSLFQPDFRASERAFSILTQVTGRAGRGERPGEVIIQTYQPGHYSIQHAMRQDYDGFYRQELRSRELMRFPPRQRLVSLLFADTDHDKAFQAARGCASALKTRSRAWPLSEVAVFGATPAPIARLRGKFRFRILVRGLKPAVMRAVIDGGLEEWRRQGAGAAQFDAMTIDVDPMDLL